MSLPILDVSLNFSSGATFGNAFTLDDPVNGVLGTANTNTLPLQLSSIQRIGALEFLKQANNVDEVRVDGSVKNIAYYPIALSTSNLVALTS